VAILTLGQLEGHLWKTADILRGSIDAADCTVGGSGKAPGERDADQQYICRYDLEK